MPMRVVCPSCLTKLRAPDNAAGHKLKCPKCGAAVVVPSPGQEVPEAPRAEVPPQRVKPAETPGTRAKSPPAGVPYLAEEELVFSPSSQKSGRTGSRAGFWIGIAAGAFVLILATIGATLWASGFFSSAKTGQGNSQAPNPNQNGPNSRENAVGSEPNTPKSEPSPEPPKEDPKVRAFKEQVSHFLEEARVGAKLLTLAPSLADTTEKARHITDLYARLPEVPAGVDPTGKVAERLKNINGTFAVAKVMVSQALELERLAPGLGKEVYEKDLPRLAKEVNEFAAEIESKLGLQPPAQR